MTALRISSVMAQAALALALASAVAALLAGPGYRMAWWPLGTGLQTMRWAATLALVAAGVSLIATVFAWRLEARRPLALALAGLVIALAVATPPIMLWQQAQQLPHLHDISTDTDQPPAFVAVLPLRRNARNPVEYDAATAAEQKRGYPDIVPVVLKMPPALAFARAEQAARAMGWDMVAAAPQDLRIEATDTTLLFGFKDDVVIRISPHANGSRVDMRSLSRLGGSDFGTNAKRIRAFMQRLAAP